MAGRFSPIHGRGKRAGRGQLPTGESDNGTLRLFFFQAEDGIRDYKVTGVQTCALPISYCSIRRKISSPSRPASQALMSSVTSLRLASLTTALSRLLVLSTGLRSKYGGITGRLAKLHLPRLTSNSSGAWISTRWPTALVTT